MPRPKRTKVVPSLPAPRLRKSIATASVRGTKVANREHSFDSLYDASDLEERNRAKIRDNTQQARRSGPGEPFKDMESPQEANETRTRVEDGGNNERSMAQLAQGAAAMNTMEDTSLSLGDLDASSSDVEVGRRETNTPGFDSSVISIGNFRRRPRQPSILGRTGRARSSSIDSDITEGTGLTGIGRNNTSSLATGAFKRRPRQSSIMGRATASDKPGSPEFESHSTIPAGARGTYGAESVERGRRGMSGERAAGKRRRPNYESDEEQADDFNPDDESTPLNLSKKIPAITSSNPRKRKLSDVEVPRSSPIPSIPSSPPVEAPPLDSSDSDEDNEPLPLPQLLPEREARALTPDVMSETMAPPLSISSRDSSPALARTLPQMRTRTQNQRARTPSHSSVADSPISSPPSLTHSPNLPTLRRPRPKNKTPPPPARLPTAQLQSFLPRRRHRDIRDPFDVESSGEGTESSDLGSDDDELSRVTFNIPNRRQRNTSRTLSMKRTAAKLTSRAKDKSLPPAKNSYTSRKNQTSDKENEGVDPNDSLMPSKDDEFEGTENSQELEERVGKELKRAARKFAEVDKWELDFEENTASSSSPNRGR